MRQVKYFLFGYCYAGEYYSVTVASCSGNFLIFGLSFFGFLVFQLVELGFLFSAFFGDFLYAWLLLLLCPPVLLLDCIYSVFRKG